MYNQDRTGTSVFLLDDCLTRHAPAPFLGMGEEEESLPLQVPYQDSSIQPGLEQAFLLLASGSHPASGVNIYV